MTKRIKIEGSPLSITRYSGPGGRAMMQLDDDQSASDPGNRDFIKVTVEDAERLARTILDELGLDHLARSLDLDRVISFGDSSRPEGAGGIGELSALMASLPPIPDYTAAIVDRQKRDRERHDRIKESNEETWLRSVMSCAAHLYTCRVLNFLGEKVEAPAGEKPVPSGVMAALYSPEELAAMGLRGVEIDEEALWHMCVSDARKLMEIVRGREIAG